MIRRRRDRKEETSSNNFINVYATRKLDYKKPKATNKENSSDNKSISGENRIYKSPTRPIGRKRLDSSSDEVPLKLRKNLKAERKNINETSREERATRTEPFRNKRIVNDFKARKESSKKIICNLKEYKLDGKELCKLRVNIS